MAFFSPTLFLLLTPLLSIATASTPPPIVNGSTTSAFPEVGMFIECQNSNSCWDFCSGTLIHPRWVVTAAHCVEDLSTGGEFYFIFGSSWSSQLDYGEVKRWVGHPNYDNQNLYNDIALVELRQPLTSIAPMPVNNNIVNQTWNGTVLDMVGFGITGTGDDQSSGVKRTADMVISQVYQEFIIVEDSEEQQNVCSGDSGGAGLRNMGNGQYEIVGVTSFTSGGCEEWMAGLLPIDRYIPWMSDYVDLSDVSEPSQPDSSPGEPSEPEPSEPDSTTDEPSQPSDQGLEWEPPLNPGDYDEEQQVSKGMCSTMSTRASGQLGLWLFALVGLCRLRQRP